MHHLHIIRRIYSAYTMRTAYIAVAYLFSHVCGRIETLTPLPSIKKKTLIFNFCHNKDLSVQTL